MAAGVCVISVSVWIVLQYLVLVTLLIDGDYEFGDVSDEFVAFGFPQRLHADLEVLDQDFLKSNRKATTVSTRKIIYQDSSYISDTKLKSVKTRMSLHGKESMNQHLLR